MDNILNGRNTVLISIRRMGKEILDSLKGKVEKVIDQFITTIKSLYDAETNPFKNRIFELLTTT